MKNLNYSALLGAVAAMILLQACSNSKTESESVTVADTADNSLVSDTEGFAPGESLAFEWRANGFEQLPSQYKWMGTGKRDDVYQPNFSLSVPETDDIVWSSECVAGGKVKSHIYFVPPKDMKGNQASFKFETDQSTKMLKYPAKYVASGEYDGFEIVQNANDRMFTEMKAGGWAYMQIGEGAKATKLRISLANAAKALNAFLPACASSKKQAAVAKTSTVRYSCEDGRVAKATYMGNDTDTPVVRLEIGDERYLLSQAVSGSGARYDNSQGEKSGKRRTWHNKGKGSLFIESEWDDVDGNDETIIHCAAP
jgi:membrane-bound inhibitor of C-type lysozyme